MTYNNVSTNQSEFEYNFNSKQGGNNITTNEQQHKDLKYTV